MSNSKRTAAQTTTIKYGFEKPSNGDGARKLLEAFVDEVLTRRLEPPPIEQSIEESFSSSSFVEKLAHPFLDKIPFKSQQHVWPMQSSTKRKQIIDLANKLRINDGCLARIRLASSQIDDSLIHSLVEGLPRNIYLQALMLQDNSITDKGVHEISLAARWHPSLHTIWLGGNQLTDECTKSICLLLKVNFVVKDINLSNKWPRHTWTGANVDVFPHISAVGAQLLADRISRGCSLTSLTLADQRVRDEGAEDLFKSLRGSRLRCLNLMANELTDGCCEVLKACLTCDQHLEKLVVSKNHFTDTGAGLIAEVLQTSNVLKALDISDNQIGAPGMASLAQSLKANMGLCILAAYGNAFDSKPVDDAMAMRLASQDFNALFATNLDFSSLSQATMSSTIGGPFDPSPSAVTGSCRPTTGKYQWGDSEKSTTSDIDEKLDKSTRHPWRASPNTEVPGIAGAGVRGHRPLSRSRSGSGGSTAGGGRGRPGEELDAMTWETQQLSRCSTSRAANLNAILEEKEEAHEAIPSPTGHAKAIDAVSPSSLLFSPVRTCVPGPVSDSGSGSSSKAFPSLGSSSDDLDDPEPDKSAMFVTPIKSKGSVSMKLSSTSASMNRLLVSDRRSSQSFNASPPPQQQQQHQQAVTEVRHNEKQRPRRLSEDVGKTRGVPNLGNMGTLPIRSNISPLQDSAQHLMYARITTPDDPPNAKAYSILQVAIDRRKEIERIKEEHKTEEYRKLKRDALWYTKPRYGLQQAAERPLPDYFWAGLKRENIYKYPHGIDRPEPTHKPKLKNLS